MANPLVPDNDAVATGAALDVLGLILGRRARILIATAGATAVDPDTLALAGDSVPLAGARGAVGGGSAVARHGRVGAGAVGAVRERGASGRDGGAGLEVGDDVLVVLVVQTSLGEAVAERIHVVVLIQDVAGGVRRHGLGSLDLGDGQGAALGNVDREAVAALVGGGLGLAGVSAGRALGRRRRRRLGRRLGGTGRIKDVQGAASRGLNGGLLAGVVGHMVAVDDVVVPVALAGLDGAGGEAESALPRTRLGRRLVLGERELVGVVVPGSEKMDGLDTGRNTEREGLLNSRHVDELSEIRRSMLRNIKNCLFGK